MVDGKKQYRDDLLPTLQQTLFDIVKPLRSQFSKVADGTGRKESLYKTDYKGDTELVDYIKQIFILTHNVYFHSEVTYKQEKNFRSTSFFKILKTYNVSSVVPCVRPDPKRTSEDENYNPL